MNRVFLLICFTFGLNNSSSAQIGELYGTVLDENNEPIINAQVFVMSGGIQQGAVVTDFDGNYSVEPLAAGIYDAVVKYEGYKRDSIYGITMNEGDGSRRVNFKLEHIAATNPVTNVTSKTGGAAPQAITGAAVKSTRYTRPLFEPRVLRGCHGVLPDKEIEKIPTHNPLDAASAAPSVYQSRVGQGLNGRRARSENTLYIVDGIVQVPTSSNMGILPCSNNCSYNQPSPRVQIIHKIHTLADIERYDLLGKCGEYLYSR